MEVPAGGAVVAECLFRLRAGCGAAARHACRGQRLPRGSARHGAGPEHREAANDLSEEILRLQGDGDYDTVDAFVGQYMVTGDQLQADLDRLGELGIPHDIVFEQGLSVLGLKPTTSP